MTRKKAETHIVAGDFEPVLKEIEKEEEVKARQAKCKHGRTPLGTREQYPDLFCRDCGKEL